MGNKAWKICVIGAGVSGLIAAETFLDEGFDCEIFERSAALGGTSEAGYNSLRLQLPKESYEFLDWPMPSSYPTYPSCDKIVSYLNCYARHFRVYKKIRFRCLVKSLQPQTDDDGWNITCYDEREDDDFTRSFDQVVVCNGLYSHPEFQSLPIRARLPATSCTRRNSKTLNSTLIAFLLLYLRPGKIEKTCASMRPGMYGDSSNGCCARFDKQSHKTIGTVFGEVDSLFTHHQAYVYPTHQGESA